MMKKITVGIIGAGRIGKVHAQSIALNIPGAKIKTIADVFMNDETQAWAESLVIENTSKDYLDIINDKDIDDLYEKLKKDNNQNAVVNAKTIFRNASNNMIRTVKNKHVIIQGLDDFIVIEKDDVLLICPKKNEQEIKQIVAEVKKQFGDDLV